MTESGDTYENALAERVNRTIKSELELYSSRKSLRETTNKIRTSIKAYNESRPHNSIDFLTPEQAHQYSGPLKKYWKIKTERRKNKMSITGLELPDLHV